LAETLGGLVQATSRGRKIVAGFATPAVAEKEPNCLARVTASGSVSGIVSSEGGGKRPHPLGGVRRARVYQLDGRRRSESGARGELQLGAHSQGCGLYPQPPASIVATTWASRSSHGSRSSTTRSAA